VAAQKLFCEKRLCFVAFSTYALVGKANIWSTFKFLKSVRFDLEPFAKVQSAKSNICQLQKSFVQNAQKKRKNLFVRRTHKKNNAFSNKENEDVAQKLFCKKHLLSFAESKNDYLLTTKTLLCFHCNPFSA